MGRVAVIGEATAVAGYALAGAVVVPAEDPPSVLMAWNALGAEVEVVVLTPSAARALGAERAGTLHPLTVVMPS